MAEGKIDKALQQLFKRSVATKVLWTNASITSAFGAQTLNLPLTDYDAVHIEARYENQNGSRTFGETCLVGLNGELVRLSGNWTSTFSTRMFAVKATGVEFADGITHVFNGANTTNNKASIPEKIYGIILSGGGYCLSRLLVALRRFLQGGGVCYGN